MQVTVENTSTLERKLTVVVPASEIQGQIDARLKEIGRQVKIKGFRPGRIPFSVLRQRYGKQVQHEIVTQAMQTSLQEAITQESLRPAAMPQIEQAPDMEAGGDIEYTAIVEVYPDLESIRIEDIEVSSPETSVTETDVDEMLQTLRLQRQTWEDAGDVAAKGHQVTLEYIADTDDGRVPATGKHRITFILGTSGFEALEKTVTGMSVGDDTDLELSFPENYSEAELAGKTAEVDLEILELKQSNLPDIDEAFIHSFGVESGKEEDLRQEVRGNLEREMKQAIKTRLKLQLLDGLIATLPDLEVPGSIVRQEAEGLQQRAARAMGGGEQTEPPPLEDFMDSATKRVKSGLLMAELASQNNIVIDGARVRESIESVAETYEHPLEVVQMYYNDQRLLQAIENAVLEEQVVDWAMDHAKVKPEPMGFKELIAAASGTG
jgi:trigger factor